MEKAKVYFTRNITSNNVVEIYNKLNIELEGNVGVKIHSGEKGNQNFLKPIFWKDIIEHVNGTVIECNTAYDGERNDSQKHLKLLDEHKWTTYFNVDLLDRTEEMALDVKDGKHLTKNFVGKNLENYDSLLILSHFKGHPMGGYGGALKNISIGLASSHGKAVIHGAGEEEKIWTADHDSFLESMAEAAKTIVDYRKDKIAYINVVANLSVDCDCCAKAEDPCMKDIGILASLDPVALDQACVDLIYKSEDEGKEYFIERIESRNGIHTIEEANRLGVGSREYELIEF